MKTATLALVVALVAGARCAEALPSAVKGHEAKAYLHAATEPDGSRTFSLVDESGKLIGKVGASAVSPDASLPWVDTRLLSVTFNLNDDGTVGILSIKGRITANTRPFAAGFDKDETWNVIYADGRRGPAIVKGTEVEIVGTTGSSPDFYNLRDYRVKVAGQKEQLWFHFEDPVEVGTAVAEADRPALVKLGKPLPDKIAESPVLAEAKAAEAPKTVGLAGRLERGARAASPILGGRVADAKDGADRDR